ncbi:modification methylase [Candidatus Epulonipiscium fishelsonii]|uniref:Modification methylase n=1 Tax=Candidatus Epulonipiscium fishelsonii TaxID=77094 RepID=A0ACC8XEG5_9FIRM|nr:modification methylase [Epulopiscium sp. SCG-B11WGA-EpuloA1]ONI43946.1 modification methylase [Epulopiscium sp. SCG-B05WGA-EpuloA1]ONI47963.1 modification methylase [Epulopiscium sp. SCG-C06WGA-EpuloA1]
MNYIGSKYSLLDFLVETIDGVTGRRQGNNLVFADVFAGTGIVGATFKNKGYDIISNDIQHYSYVLNKHYIENTSPINADLLEYLNNLEGIEGFVYNNYCFGSGAQRKYFTDYNGKKCDAIRTELENLYLNKKINSSKYYYYLASLINSIDKYANTASIYGSFLKHIKKSASKNFGIELLPIINGSANGKVYNKDVNELIKEIKGDILYLDPPYNARQYCSNYHVLETISRYDNPNLKGKTGLRSYENKKSLYCSKKAVKETFDELIKNSNFKYIFLSYNNEGLMPMETIKEIMQKYGEYKLFTKEYRRFKADRNESRNHKAVQTIECLHCLIK